MTVSVSTVDAIGEKTRLQAKAALFPAEMLFFHGSALAEKKRTRSARFIAMSYVLGVDRGQSRQAVLDSRWLGGK
jgi:hypothetical protein